MNADRDASENVRDLLTELTENDADTVRPLLLTLQSMATGEVPAPSPELAALLESNGAQVTAARRRIRHRGVVFSLALIGALAAGAGTATAVSPEFRTGAANAIAGMIKAIPFGRATVPNTVPSGPPTTHTPGPPTKVGGTSHPTPASSDPAKANGNGKSSSDHANPRSTSHPTPPSTPPANGHDGGAP